MIRDCIINDYLFDLQLYLDGIFLSLSLCVCVCVFVYFIDCLVFGGFVSTRLRIFVDKNAVENDCLLFDMIVLCISLAAAAAAGVTFSALYSGAIFNLK